MSMDFEEILKRLGERHKAKRAELQARYYLPPFPVVAIISLLIGHFLKDAVVMLKCQGDDPRAIDSFLDVAVLAGMEV